MKALLLGSISVLADTSELQRCAYNDAFHEAGLDWYWSRDDYRRMLEDTKGQDLIEAFSERCGERVDAGLLHGHKSDIFRQMLAHYRLELRPHVAQALADARDEGLRIALVSGTSRDSLDALLGQFGGAAALGIELITSADDGKPAKPDPALYRHALTRLGVEARDAIAIEDDLAGLVAAQAAGITCYVYPNENTMLHDFGEAPHLSDRVNQRAA